MILSVLGIQRHSLPARRNALVPITEREVGAAEQIVRFGVLGSAANSALQRYDGFVDAALGKQFAVRGVSGGEGRKKCKQKHERKFLHCKHFLVNHLYR